MPNKCDMPHEEGCFFAAQAAKLAVRETFAILGVDVERPESVEDFRKDLRYSGHLRRLSDHGGKVLWGLVVAALAASTWYGIVFKVVGGH